MTRRPSLHEPRMLAALGLTVLGLAACGSSTPSPTAAPTTPSPSSAASASSSAAASPTSLTLSAATLVAADFSTGAKDEASSNVPDLTSVKCTPNTTQGLQQQYKSEVTAASGRVYGNVVAGFDTSADAHTFVTDYYTGTQSCTDASSQPIQDNFGDYSFYYTIKGSPNDLRVEAVQVGSRLTLVIQLLPTGTQPDQQSLRDLTQASVTKLQHVSG